MSPEIAVSIPLKVWQDPQGDVVLHASRDECVIYFACWASSGEPADYICRLGFSHAWAVRGYCSESPPYERSDGGRSSVLEVKNSAWLREASAERQKNYPRWREWDVRTYHHYVVTGHDNYFEIIAAGFAEQTLSRAAAGELARLIDES